MCECVRANTGIYENTYVAVARASDILKVNIAIKISINMEDVIYQDICLQTHLKAPYVSISFQYYVQQKLAASVAQWLEHLS